MFVWDEKPDKINRKTVHKDIECGGLRLPCIKSFVQALKATWIRKFINTKHKWKNIAITNFPFLNQIQSYGPEKANRFLNKNAFWAQVFDSYKAFWNKCYPKTPIEMTSEPLFYNNKIILPKNIMMVEECQFWCISKGFSCV